MKSNVIFLNKKPYIIINKRDFIHGKTEEFNELVAMFCDRHRLQSVIFEDSDMAVIGSKLEVKPKDGIIAIAAGNGGIDIAAMAQDCETEIIFTYTEETGYKFL